MSVLEAQQIVIQCRIGHNYYAEKSFEEWMVIEKGGKMKIKVKRIWIQAKSMI